MEKQTPESEVLFELADLFKVFGDSTRLRIMYALSEDEKNVLSIAEELGMEQSTISHQLRILRANKLVRGRREGKHSKISTAPTARAKSSRRSRKRTAMKT